MCEGLSADRATKMLEGGKDCVSNKALEQRESNLSDYKRSLSKCTELRSNPASGYYRPCDLEQVTWDPHTSVSPSVEWG